MVDAEAIRAEELRRDGDSGSKYEAGAEADDRCTPAVPSCRIIWRAGRMVLASIASHPVLTKYTCLPSRRYPFIFSKSNTEIDYIKSNKLENAGTPCFCSSCCLHESHRSTINVNPTDYDRLLGML